MKDNEKKANKTTVAVVGFVAGVITVILVVFAMRGC